jgi:hypothetical protein
MKIIKLRELPPLALALFLQFAPVADKLAQVNPALPSASPLGIVVRWVAAIAAMAGTVQAVSGASAAIAGMSKISPPSLPSFSVTGAVNQAFAYRIVVTNPGLPNGGSYYDVTNLPPGLMIWNGLNGSGFITNTPTVAGVYAVLLVAGNTNYGYITTNATITITGGGGNAAPSITTQPKSLTVTNGNSATFTVVATGTPAPTYQWHKGPAIISGATGTSYTIASTTTNDTADYTVVVSNSVNSVTSSAATLTVLVPPAITTPPASLNVTNGNSATFTVLATGVPAPAYQWMKGAGAISGATSSSYTISSVTTNDAGSYSVLVSNPAGSTNSPPATLSVYVPAVVPLTLSTPAYGAGGFTFDITGPSGTNYVVWRSIDLSTWTAIKTNFSASGTVHFADTNPPAATATYRTMLSP